MYTQEEKNIGRNIANSYKKVEKAKSTTTPKDGEYNGLVKGQNIVFTDNGTEYGIKCPDDILQKGEDAPVSLLVIGKSITVKSDTIEKGGEHKTHKYLKIENGKYIYDHDQMTAKDHESAAKYHSNQMSKYESANGVTDKAKYEEHKKQHEEHSRLAKVKEFRESKDEEIGKTTSGKSITKKKPASEYPDFTSQDHEDAAKLHREKLQTEKGVGHDYQATEHDRLAKEKKGEEQTSHEDELARHNTEHYNLHSEQDNDHESGQGNSNE